MDDTRFSSSFRETRLKYWELMARVARLEAESVGESLVLPETLMKEKPALATDEQDLYLARQRSLESQVSVLQQQAQQRQQELVERRAKQQQLQRSFELSNQELQMSEPLVAQGVMSEVELLRLKRTVNDLRGEMDANRLAIPRIQSALNEVQRKITEEKVRFQTEAARELSEVKAEYARTEESIFALEDRVTRTEVRAPVKGTVKRILLNTIGGVIQPGEDLVEIVPVEDNLLIEAHIRPSDIAFLRPGQDAMVKFTAYDFSIYGGLPAKLERISADTITNEKDESFYLIYLRTNQNTIESSKGNLEIIPGMTTTVDILTGKKTVMDYLLKPILKAKNEALRER
ncbi:HlyD family type I secretion periplasmic adaptor subunit [Methylophaga frappieri]|uniref:HlyD family type I secretion periplasmic adaptor subunit n=1 Tax=Methylophaga frappieri (strain ATCC BAA-2434 / DSM 25690 / JAM7) TaxID=754477 RepID=UPI001EE645A9|nr:HlyD family type I secretion periplasmic adaptor subunit [Methylophaga frappieri]